MDLYRPRVQLRACAYEETPLKGYQAVVPPEKPLARMEKASRDEAWVRICREIKKAMGKSGEG